MLDWSAHKCVYVRLLVDRLTTSFVEMYLNLECDVNIQSIATELLSSAEHAFSTAHELNSKLEKC